MAALPYIQLYVSDYLADTAHLNAAQHGAYLLLIFNYWQRGKSLNNSNERLANVARMSNEEWVANKAEIAEFFVIDGDEWTHTRVEMDLAAVHAKSTKASASGKASANKRSMNAQRTFNERSTIDGRSFNQTDTDTDTEKNKSKTFTQPLAASKKNATAMLVELGVEEQPAKDWLAVRKAKRAPLTKTALDELVREAGKAGITVNEAVTICAQRSWQGFNASWDWKGSGAKSPSKDNFDAKDYGQGVSAL